MEPLGNDRWRARFVVEEIGWYEFEVEGWVDHFASWRHGLERWLKARQDVSSELLEGAAHDSRRCRTGPPQKERRRLISTAAALVVADAPVENFARSALANDLPADAPADRPRQLDPVRHSTRARRSRARAFQHVVRDVPAVSGPRSDAQRNVSRGRLAHPRNRRHGLRRALSAADSPDRPHQPQGPRQYAGGRARAIPEAHGRSAAPRVATRRSSPASARSTISAGSASRPNASGSKSRSTSPIRSSPDHPYATASP